MTLLGFIIFWLAFSSVISYGLDLEVIVGTIKAHGGYSHLLTFNFFQIGHKIALICQKKICIFIPVKCRIAIPAACTMNSNNDLLCF